ncbi:signal peptidase I [Halalkaliarchaeum desulfuricum]|uniref:Signal peptidase I n=1 Tax=Halalkaliarchaeum desulfuricum TaxID=2055893 RepID=A0A343TEY8_9EURY|nr:S26 family signal peptidase [Halalkaliarchaeum desulfuricum]AUX07660.1 signal peptidase I [Halalkaliarchaeum desulfuricum]
MTSGERSPADEDDSDGSESFPSDEGTGEEADVDEVVQSEGLSGSEVDINQVDGDHDDESIDDESIDDESIDDESIDDESTDDPDRNDRTPLERFLNDQDGPYMVVREVLLSVAVVLVIGLVLFAISGVWPPLVAVESTSMEPNMKMGDLVLVTEPGRYAPDAAVSGTGVVTYEQGAEVSYETFGMPGSVIVFDPPDRTGSPIIHRAHHHVEEGENWYDRVDQDAMNADSCEELATCPAPHDGFITKGDHNRWYDQDYEHNGIAPVVHEDWVTGVARVRVPMLGWIRLIFTGEAGPFAGTLPSVPFPEPETLLVASGASAVAAGRNAGWMNRWN